MTPHRKNEIRRMLEGAARYSNLRVTIPSLGHTALRVTVDNEFGGILLHMTHGAHEEALARLIAACPSALRELLAYCEELERNISDMVFRHGGKNVGFMFGPANCATCGQLANDYYLVGKSQLCIPCWNAFPDAAQKRGSP